MDARDHDPFDPFIRVRPCSYPQVTSLNTAMQTLPSQRYLRRHSRLLDMTAPYAFFLLTWVSF